MKKLFKFQKDYWFINNGKPAVIPPFEEDLDRNRKLKKILDKINRVKHKYIESEDEKYLKYLKKIWNRKSLISNLK